MSQYSQDFMYATEQQQQANNNLMANMHDPNQIPPQFMQFNAGVGGLPAAFWPGANPAEVAIGGGVSPFLGGQPPPQNMNMQQMRLGPTVEEPMRIMFNSNVSFGAQGAMNVIPPASQQMNRLLPTGSPLMSMPQQAQQMGNMMSPGLGPRGLATNSNDLLHANNMFQQQQQQLLRGGSTDDDMMSVHSMRSNHNGYQQQGGDYGRRDYSGNMNNNGMNMNNGNMQGQGGQYFQGNNNNNYNNQNNNSNRGNGYMPRGGGGYDNNNGGGYRNNGGGRGGGGDYSNRNNNGGGGRGDNSPFSNNSGPRDPLVDEFRASFGKGSGRTWTIQEMATHVVAFCQDQHGSRFIQQRLEICTPDERHMVFEEILPMAQTLMTDVFGNYVLQKLFEYGTPDQCEQLSAVLKGQAVAMSLQMYGCRVVQKALEFVKTDRLVELVAEFEAPSVSALSLILPV